MTVYISNPWRKGKSRRGQDGRKTSTEETEKRAPTRKTESVICRKHLAGRGCEDPTMQAEMLEENAEL